MKKIFYVLPALLMLSCGGDKGGDMPWGDDLGGGNNNGNTNLPTNTIEVGQPLPAWSEGELDIHYISTGRGECAFYILPDGTTLLVDAGEFTADKADNPLVPQRPNELTRPAEAQSRYIKNFLPTGKSYIDYCAPSHLHIDHIGGSKVDGVATLTTASAADGGYRKAGLLYIYDQVPYKVVMDGFYPGYAEDEVTAALDGELSKDWANFVTAGVKNGKFEGKRFNAGEESIVLRNNRDAYSNFRIFNICANGFVVKKGTDGKPVVGERASTEKGNPASCGFHLSYGNFDHIACGDLTGAPQNRVSEYFRDFIGSKNLESFKCHHHLNANGWGSGMQNNSFDPRVIVNMNFYKSVPDAGLLRGILDNEWMVFWNKDFYTTSIHPDQLTEDATKNLFARVAGYDGHVVVRVAKGGETYWVYMLDNTNFEYKVKSIHGPYTSK
ncbi:MAG: hypothetical protein IJX65_00965 [Alistipes sp.]|nr:hypothetical protein [Alistipes sp.]